MVDLVIRGGRVVDGTGGPARVADVAVDGERIVEVGRVTGRGRRELDADGLVVAPGWVDIHTHYDGQVTWDPVVAPSSTNGVTSAVMGNCGVGFAPARPGDAAHDWLIGLLEGVEDIPGTALAEGLTWEWESFPEYLDAVERMPHALDLGGYLPHAALRAYVMGERGADHQAAASSDELARMADLTREAMAAGAVGFATSRTIAHRTRDGHKIGTLTASELELHALGGALRDAGRGVIQLISDAYLSSDRDLVDAELAMMESLVAHSGRPLSMTVQQPEDVAERWRELIGFVAHSRAFGLPMRAQVAPRGIGLILGLQATLNPFAKCPSYLEVAGLPLAERAAALGRPERRAAVLAEHGGTGGRVLGDVFSGFHKLFELSDPADYEPDPSSALGARAAREGVTGAELAFDRMVADGGTSLFYMPIHNYASGNLDAVREMLASEHTLVALSDAGAHCGMICDGTFPTTLLAHWTHRTRGEGLPIELLVHKQTQRNARWVGWHDRGLVGPGYLADLNLIDLDALSLRAPRIVHDLPAGGRRLMQDAVGYRTTVKRGEVTFEDGVHTGALPGRLVRGDQPEPAR